MPITEVQLIYGCPGGRSGNSNSSSCRLSLIVLSVLSSLQITRVLEQEELKF